MSQLIIMIIMLVPSNFIIINLSPIIMSVKKLLFKRLNPYLKKLQPDNLPTKFFKPCINSISDALI